MTVNSLTTKERETDSLERQHRAVAVIDVGTSSIRMAIAELDDHGGVRRLESLTQAVSLGKDTFTFGQIEKSTIEECVRVLRSYRSKLAEYRISDPEQIRVVATSAVREAKNRLAFLDRVYIATGLQIDPIDEAEVHRVTYLGIQQFLKTDPDLAHSRTLVIEVGGGSTELLVLKGTNITFSNTYRLGSLRLRKTLETYQAPTLKLRELMENQIDQTVSHILQQLPAERSVELIALGGDVRFAVSQIDPSWQPSIVAKVPLASLENFTEQILKLSVDELVQRYRLSFPDAETIGPALLAYVRLAAALKVSSVHATETSLRDGLLKEMATRGAWTGEFREQIVRSALELGKKFEFDEAHALHVAELSSNLFKQLENEHNLDSRYELILYVAALLHEVGLFISNRSYHKHTMYLIRNSEMFGLSRNDQLLVSLVARYHRRASPQPTHEGYQNLPRDLRVAVSKMAALLRLAKALDASRSQRIQTIECSRQKDRLVITVIGVDDLSLEQLALRQSGTLYEEIFGSPVLLRKSRR